MSLNKSPGFDGQAEEYWRFGLMGKSELNRHKPREEYRVDSRNVKESSANYV
jgi:hypothetical protein